MATLDVNKAIAHLRSHAHVEKPHGKCATYVKQALAAGGLPYISGCDGFEVGSVYEKKYGFKRVNLKQNGRNFIGAVAGDICSIATNIKIGGKFPNYNRNGEIYPGHACMFDGTQWISDYKQSTCIPYSLSSVKWARVWRWKDIPGDFKIPPEDNAASDSISNDGISEGGGVGSGPSQVIIVPNQYPMHSEYITYSGSNGNLFESSEKNKATFKSAALAEEENYEYLNSNNVAHTRIYSTNDSCIVLDPLALPLDSDYVENYANKNITHEDVKKHNESLKQQEEEAKKKQEEEEKKKQEESKTEEQKKQEEQKKTDDKNKK